MAITDSIGRAIEGSASAIAAALLQALPKPLLVKQVDEDHKVVAEIRDLVKELESRLGRTTDDQLSTQHHILNELRQIRQQNANAVRTGRANTSRPGVGAPRNVNQTVAAALGSRGNWPANMRRGGSAGAPITNVATRGGGGAPLSPRNIANGIGLSTIVPMIGSAILGGIGYGLSSVIESSGIQLEKVFSGVMGSEFQFSTSMKKRASETADYGESLKDASKRLHDIGKITQETGATRAAFQNDYIKQLKRGMQLDMVGGKLQRRNVKTLQQMLKNSQSTAFAIGMDTHKTAETFDLWSRKLRLSKTELFQVGFSMRDIARNTGVTSDAMEEVVQSSQALFERMKLTGALTASTMDTTLKVMAAGSKYGVSDINAQVLEGLSSFGSMLEMQDKNLQTFLLRSIMNAKNAAPQLRRALQSGMALDESFFPDVGKSLVEELQRNLERVGLGGMKAQNLDIEMRALKNRFVQAEQSGNAALAGQISNQIMRAELVLKQLGIPLGQIEGLSKSMREAIVTPAERIEKLNKELSIATTDEARNRLKSGIADIENSITNKALSMYDDVLKVTGSSEEALKAAGTQFKAAGLEMGGLAGFQKRIGQTFGSMENMLGVEKMSQILKEQGFTSLASLQTGLMKGTGTTEGDMARNAFEALMNAASVKSQTKDNPILSIQTEIAEANDTLSRMAGAWIFKMTDTTLKGIIVAALAAQAASVAMGSVQTVRLLYGLFGGGVSGGGAGARYGGLLNMAGRATGVGANPFATMSGHAGAVARTTQQARVLSAGAGGSSVFAQVLGPLQVAIGGLIGYLQAEEAGRNKTEGVLLGALTGGAKTGSMFSGMLGVQKGGGLDKALGVAGGAAWGAAAGAAIGAAFFGVGAAPGAAVGAIIGAGVELLKIITEGTDLFYKAIVLPLGPIVPLLEGAWDALAGLFTLDLGRVGKGITTMLLSIPIWLGRSIKNVIDGGPDLIAIVLKKAFIDLPRWLYDAFASLPGMLAKGLQSIIGTVFGESAAKMMQPFVDKLVAVRDVVMKVVDPIYDSLTYVWEGIWSGLQEAQKEVAKALDPLWEAFSELGNAISLSMGYISTAFAPLGEAFAEIAKAIGLPIGEGTILKFVLETLGGALIGTIKYVAEFIKIAVVPLSWVIKNVLAPAIYGVAIVVKSVVDAITVGVDMLGSLVKGISGLFSWLYDVLIGHSIIPDLINGIIDWFWKLPGNVMKAITSTFTDAFSSLPQLFINALTPVWDWIKSWPTRGVSSVGASAASIGVGIAGRVGGSLAAIHNVPNQVAGMLGLGAFAGKTPVSEAIAEASTNRVLETIKSSVVNTGAFESKSVTEALAQDKMGVRMAQLVGSDINNVVESVKEEMSSKPKGGATKALYLSEEDIDNIDTHLMNSYNTVNGMSPSSSVSASMFTPEDAAEYVYSQMDANKPANAESTGLLDTIAEENMQQTRFMQEMLVELKKFNSSVSGGSSRNVLRPSAGLRSSKAASKLTEYRHDKLRGFWPDLQAIAANSQDNLDVRPA